MNIRIKIVVLAPLLALVGIADAFGVYLSISIGNMTASVPRGLGFHAGDARISWDDWLLAFVSAASLFGAVGLFLRRQWGRIVSLLALGTSAVWALAVAITPETLRETWFSFWTDRWLAFVVALVALAAFRWLCSERVCLDFVSHRRPV